MNRHGSIADVVEILVSQDYCDECHYNADGICMAAEAQDTRIYIYCVNAAKKWLESGVEEND